MRIDKLLANMGYGSRKDVKKLLKVGMVRLDDIIVKDGKVQVDPTKQTVTVAGEIVEYKPYIYLMMNKPAGVISATEDDRHETVIDLLTEEYAVYNPFPVGRLDKDTTGFLLLTNDGQFSHALMSPRRNVPKTYIAKVRGFVDESDIARFKEGLTLDDGYVTKPAALLIKEQGAYSHIELTITEGKYHQVKRMFEAVEKKVVSLRRIKIGEVTIDPRLGLGAYRELSAEEYEKLIEGYRS